MRRDLVPFGLAMVLLGCSKPAEPTAPPPDAPAPADAGDGPSQDAGDDDPFAEQHANDADRPVISKEDCEAQGTIVGDIGNGAVHKKDYVCDNGQAPIGRVELGIEGAVCCPNA